MEIIFTDRFLNRVEEYSDYIALDNIPAAIKWTEEVFEYCQQLKSNPQMGRMVPEFQYQEIRELIHENYRLIYELQDSRIDMLTVWHGRKHSPKSPKEL